MGKPLLKMLFGGLAGLLVWMIMEPSAPKSLESSEWPIWSARTVLFLGLAVGLTLGAFNGWLQGSKWHVLKGMALGGVLGAAGANWGAGMGTLLLSVTFGANALNGGNIVLAIPARILALTPIGTLMGFAVGASSLNWRRALLGMVGGTIGGGIAAALFDPVSQVLGRMIIAARGLEGQVAEVGLPGRVLFCVLSSMLIGLFVGLVEQAARTAWVRLVLGRNEGKEWVIDSSQVILGRSETAGIPLFGDPAIQPTHASITRRAQDQYWLSDMGSPTGTFLNGQRVTEAPLFHGALIQLGSTKLEFLMKIGTAPARAAEALRAQQAYPLAGQVPVAPMAYPPGVPSAGGAAALSMPQAYATAQPTIQAPVSASTLLAIAGPLTGQRFVVNQVVEMGREGTAVSLAFDQTVSRRHVSFSPGPAGVTVTDLNSTNGTFVNDQRVQAAVLKPGDVVRVGLSSFRLE